MFDNRQTSLATYVYIRNLYEGCVELEQHLVISNINETEMKKDVLYSTYLTKKQALGAYSSGPSIPSPSAVTTPGADPAATLPLTGGHTLARPHQSYLQSGS